MGFLDPIVGGTVLRIPAIQSPNYEAGVSGWAIFITGDAEFNDVTVRGEFEGTDFIIDSSGIFFYGGTPAAGNLEISIARSAGTDAFGNAYPAGWSVGAAGTFEKVVGGLINGSPLIYFLSAISTALNNAALMLNITGTGSAAYDVLVIKSSQDSAHTDYVALNLDGNSNDGTTHATQLSLAYVDTGAAAHTYLQLKSAGLSLPLGVSVAGTLKATGTIAAQPSASGNTLISGNVGGTDANDRLRILVNSIAMGPGTAARDVQIARTGTGLFVVSNPATTHGVVLAVDGNAVIGGTAALGDNGVGELQLANATTAPTTNPAGGGVLYAGSGVPHWRDSGGQLLGMVRSYYAAASGSLSSFTAETAVPGATFTVVVTGNNATVKIWGKFDFLCGTSGTTFVGFLKWAGSDQAEQAVFVGATGGRANVGQNWEITGVTAGSYTAALYATCGTSGAQNKVEMTHTTISALVVEG